MNHETTILYENGTGDCEGREGPIAVIYRV